MGGGGVSLVGGGGVGSGPSTYVLDVVLSFDLMSDVNVMTRKSKNSGNYQFETKFSKVDYLKTVGEEMVIHNVVYSL